MQFLDINDIGVLLGSGLIFGCGFLGTTHDRVLLSGGHGLVQSTLRTILGQEASSSNVRLKILLLFVLIEFTHHHFVEGGGFFDLLC